MAAAIFASSQFLRTDLRAKGTGFVESGFWKMKRQIVLPKDREHVHAFGVRGAEHFDDFTFGTGMARLPFAEFNDNFITDLRGPANVARFGHIDVMRNARIVRNDVEELAAALEGANNLSPAPGQNSDHFSGVVLGRLRASAAGPNVTPDEHAVFVQSSGGGAFGDGDFLEAGFVRQQEAFALAVDANAPGNEVGFAGKDVTVAFDAR